ncbi:MAG: hypothetical protein V7K85_21865 [Nostoc sp.]
MNSGNYQERFWHVGRSHRSERASTKGLHTLHRIYQLLDGGDRY